MANMAAEIGTAVINPEETRLLLKKIHGSGEEINQIFKTNSQSFFQEVANMWASPNAVKCMEDCREALQQIIRVAVSSVDGIVESCVTNVKNYDLLNGTTVSAGIAAAVGAPIIPFAIAGGLVKDKFANGSSGVKIGGKADSAIKFLRTMKDDIASRFGNVVTGVNNSTAFSEDEKKSVTEVFRSLTSSIEDVVQEFSTKVNAALQTVDEDARKLLQTNVSNVSKVSVTTPGGPSRVDTVM